MSEANSCVLTLLGSLGLFRMKSNVGMKQAKEPNEMNYKGMSARLDQDME